MPRTRVTPVVPALLALLGSACTSEPEPGEPPHRNGLLPVAQVEHPMAGPHLVELVALADRWVYVANSNDVLAVYELTEREPWTAVDDPFAAWPHRGEPEGQPGLRLRLAQADGAGEVRCTNLALHAASESLWCGSDDGRGITRFDLADPAAPMLDQINWRPAEFAALHLRDLEVVGDHLYLARFQHGLARVAIDPAGGLGELEPVELAGNVRRLASDARGRLWVLTSDRGLLVLDHDAAGTTELATLPLDGPALDVAAWGDEAIVALGSEGATIVGLTDEGTLEPRASLVPPGVVSSVDLRDDLASVITLTGAWVYERRAGEAPRLAGFRNSGAWHYGERKGSMLHGRLVADDLLVTDWNWVSRFEVDPRGEVVGLDLPRAVYVASEDARVRVPLRNVGAVPLTLDFYALGERIDRRTIAAGETLSLELDAARFEIDVPEFLTVLVRDGEGLVAHLATVILRRPPAADWPITQYGAPAPGQPFPAVALGQGTLDAMTPLWLPLPDVAQRIVFYGTDCAAMWPQVEDIAHRVTSGRLAPGTAVLATHQNPLVEGFTERWALEGVPWGTYGPDVLAPELLGINPWDELYDEAFGLHQLPGAAYHPTDYEIDAQGRVVAVEREYRGAHGLW